MSEKIRCFFCVEGDPSEVSYFVYLNGRFFMSGVSVPIGYRGLSVEDVVETIEENVLAHTHNVTDSVFLKVHPPSGYKLWELLNSCENFEDAYHEVMTHCQVGSSV